MKHSFKCICVVLLLVNGFYFMESCTSTQNGFIVIKGSTTMSPLLERLISAHGKNIDIQITVEPVGSLACNKFFIHFRQPLSTVADVDLLY